MPHSDFIEQLGYIVQKSQSKTMMIKIRHSKRDEGSHVKTNKQKEKTGQNEKKHHSPLRESCWLNRGWGIEMYAVIK